MRILIIASGSRGDVQPYIALGVGLKKDGHEVRLVTHQNFAGLVISYGLEFWPVEVNVQAIAKNSAMEERLEQGNFLLLMAEMAKEAKRGAVQLAESSLAASQGIDLVLAGLGGLYTGLALAEKLHVPFLQAYYVPFTVTRHFASVLSPGLPAGPGGSFNRLSHHLTRQLFWQGFRPADQISRREVLDLPAARFWGPYNSEPLRGMPILYGYSPRVIPPPPDWEASAEVTGYWFLDSAEDWTPPQELTGFLERGPAPVYIGFGSMSNRKPEEITALVIEALRRSKQRAILLSGWGGLQKMDLPDSIFMIDSVPHEWLFERVSVVVHHGGAGTTAAGLRAGVPSVIIPFFGDQPFWGQRVAELGVGPEPIARKKLTVERIAQAIHTAVTDQDMRQRATRLGAKIKAEDGTARAVEVIQKLVINRG